MKKDKVQLTDNAKRELEMFRNEQAQQLIDIIVRDKSYPGLDKLEVTAGDIMKYGKRIVVYNERKKNTISLLAWTYMFLGIILVFLGLFFDTFTYMIHYSPERLMFIGGGLFLVLFSFLILRRSYLFNNRYTHVKETPYNEERYSRFKDAEASFNRANLKFDIRDFEGALVDYDKAIELDPYFFEAYFNRGLLKYNKRDWKGALVDYDKAIELKTDDSDVYNSRGITRFKMGDFDGAFADYNKAIELKPDNADAYCNRGNTRSKIGDFEGAFADYNKAIELKPDNADAFNNRAFGIWLKSGNLDKALADVNIAINIDNKVPTFYETRGEIYRELNKYDKAIEDFDYALVLYGRDDMEVYENRAKCYREMAENESDEKKKNELIAKATADEEKAKSL